MRSKGVSGGHRLAVLLGILVVGAGPVGALAEPVPSVASSALSVDQLMTLSATSAALTQLPHYLERGLDEARRAGTGVPDGVFERLKAALPAVYGEEKTRPLALASLQAQVSQEDMSSWARFYTSSLGRKVALLEQGRAGARDEAEVTAQSGVLLQRLKADSVRFALIKELSTHSYAVERALGTVLGLSAAIRWAALQTDAVLSQGVAFAELRQVTDAERDQLRPEMEAWVWASLAHATRDLSTDELSQWLTQLKSPAGQRVYRDFGDRLSRLIIERAELLGPLVAAAR